MIKLFRNIRQNLLNEGKTTKYFKYAIGEIILVVIGIMIALSINNWNTGENLSKQELGLLENIKNDVDLDIMKLKSQDSLFAVFEANSKIAIKLFYKARTIKDIDSVNSLVTALWNELYINQNTYSEMIGSGSLYTMKNKKLQALISNYYLQAEANKTYIREGNKIQDELWELNPDIYPYKLLISQIKNNPIDVKSIDTTWIHDSKSPTYLAVNNYLNSDLEVNNTYRRSVYQRIIKSAKKLSAAIAEELNSRKN